MPEPRPDARSRRTDRALQTRNDSASVREYLAAFSSATRKREPVSASTGSRPSTRAGEPRPVDALLKGNARVADATQRRDRVAATLREPVLRRRLRSTRDAARRPHRTARGRVPSVVIAFGRVDHRGSDFDIDASRADLAAADRHGSTSRSSPSCAGVGMFRSRRARGRGGGPQIPARSVGAATPLETSAGCPASRCSVHGRSDPRPPSQRPSSPRRRHVQA